MAEPSYWVAPTTAWDPTTITGWDECASLDQVGTGGTYARDDGAETLFGEVARDQVYDFRRKSLGYSYADSGSPWYLHRVNPIPHPDEQQLTCTSADIVGKNIQGIPTSPPTTPATYTAMVPALVTGSTLPFRPRYSRAVCTMKFRPPTYPHLTDAEMLSLAAANGYATRLPEYFRNTEIFSECDSQLQVLAPGSTPIFEWADIPPGGAAPLQGTQDLIDQSQLPILLPRADLKMIWHHVPAEYVMGPGGYLPTKIMAAMGKLNSNGVAAGATDVPWLGVFPRGTLKMEAPRFRKAIQSHIRTTSRLYISAVYDIEFNFSYTNPVMAALAGSAQPTFGGWNAFLYGLKRLFYSIRRRGDISKGVFDYYDYDLMFTHAMS